MAVLSRLHHDFGSSVGVDEVERILSGARPDTDDELAVELDLSRCRQVELGAGFRLGNALRRWGGGELRVRVPEPGDFSGDWFLTFTRSGLGLALASSRAEIIAGAADISERVRKYYADKGDVSSQNYGVRVDIDSGALTPDIDSFAYEFNALAKRVSLGTSDVQTPERSALANIGHEAVRNVVDHAFRKPWPGPPESQEKLAYVSLRHYATLGASENLGAIFHEFVQRAQAAAEADEQVVMAWLELVICDNGVGIAARQSQDLDIYRRGIEEEDAALADALRAGGSIKLATNDAEVQGAPGFGLNVITGALSRLGGQAILRAGRRRIAVDTTVSSAFEVDPQALGWMPGTTMQILLPLRSPQLRLHS
jgi:hypothetical protein